MVYSKLQENDVYIYDLILSIKNTYRKWYTISMEYLMLESEFKNIF